MKNQLISILVAIAVLSIFVGCEPIENVERVYLQDFVDGDTFWAMDENGASFKVRLIGLDAPESVHANTSKNTVWGEYSSAAAKEWLSEKTTEGESPLYLEYDEEKEDQYGRRLAYVWDDASTIGDTSQLVLHCMNAYMISEGMAKAKKYSPNVKYNDEFFALGKEAKDNNKGNWQYDGYRELYDKK